jgi:hypothetical protein
MWNVPVRVELLHLLALVLTRPSAQFAYTPLKAEAAVQASCSTSTKITGVIDGDSSDGLLQALR